MEWLCGAAFGWVACMVLTRAGWRLLLMADRMDSRRELRRIALAQERSWLSSPARRTGPAVVGVVLMDVGRHRPPPEMNVN